MTDGKTSDAPVAARSYLWWSLAGGAIFAVTALIAAPLVGLEISSDLGNGSGHTTWITLVVGVFLVGAAFTWLVMSRAQRFSAARGAATGILTALFSYPVVITLSELLHRNGQEPPPFGERVDSVVLVTALTLMTTGFATTLISAAVGAIATGLLVLLHRPTAAAAKLRAREEWQASRRRAPVAAVVLATLAIVVLVGSYFWLTMLPLDTKALDVGGPAGGAEMTYDDALATFHTLAAVEAALPLHELCSSSLLTHGAKAARAVIYFHGFTSCPAQGDKLAATLFAMGYNVYLPRMPGHGEASPTPASMTELTAVQLIDLANESVDIARGLGDEVTVIGLSAGGTMATWTAHYRADVDQVIAVSPFFGPYIVPPWAMHAATNLTLGLPDIAFAWNPLQNIADSAGFPVAMPATHALAEIMLVGSQVLDGARQGAPAARNVGFLLNAADVAVSNALTDALIAYWRGHGAEVTVEILPFSLHLPHDVINHRERGGDTDLVHAALIEMMSGAGQP